VDEKAECQSLNMGSSKAVERLNKATAVHLKSWIEVVVMQLGLRHHPSFFICNYIVHPYSTPKQAMLATKGMFFYYEFIAPFGRLGSTLRVVQLELSNRINGVFHGRWDNAFDIEFGICNRRDGNSSHSTGGGRLLTPI
jgi:hypothetical protein